MGGGSVSGVVNSVNKMENITANNKKSRKQILLCLLPSYSLTDIIPCYFFFAVNTPFGWFRTISVTLPESSLNFTL